MIEAPSQRVEKSHHLIKMLDVNTKTTLPKLFEAVNARVDGECHFEVVSQAREDGNDHMDN